ncbi:MAG: M23 family metallopeptidase [Acidobacteriota bacterium]
MARRSYTVILAPHAGAKFRKIHFSRLSLALIAIGGGLGLLVSGALAFHYVRFHRELTELRRLRTLNAELRRQNLDYEVSVEHLNGRVSALQDFVKKLSVMAGLDTTLPGDSAGGIGGPASDDYVSSSSAYQRARESLDQMAGDLASLEEKSRVLERFYEQHSLMLASTPSIWPVRGYLSSPYGMRRDPFTGQREFHPGIDISTPIGRPVVATADGIVLYASRRGSYGKVIVIDHNFGMMTRYAHLSRFNVRAGKRVKRGDVVGYVGNTGRSNAPHLHYEVWSPNGLDHPLNYILEYAKTYMARDLRSRQSAVTAP